MGLMTSRRSGVIDQKSAISISLAIALFAAGYVVVTHMGNTDIHHSTQCLNDTYMAKAVSQERWTQVFKQLDKIQEQYEENEKLLRSLGATTPGG